MNNKNVYLALKLLSLFGIGLSVYLLYEQIFRPPFVPCNINSWINCNAVISGEVSKTFGIPTPLIGLVGYIIILIAAFIKNVKLLLGMATFGLVYCLALAYIEIVQLHVLCPVCILCQLTMISIFALGVWLQFKKPTSGTNNPTTTSG